jgi:hypothetical protein
MVRILTSTAFSLVLIALAQIFNFNVEEKR